MGIVDQKDCYDPNIEAKKHMFTMSRLCSFAMMCLCM
jgi:hypothetical protein